MRSDVAGSSHVAKRRAVSQRVASRVPATYCEPGFTECNVLMTLYVYSRFRAWWEWEV